MSTTPTGPTNPTNPTNPSGRLLRLAVASAGVVLIAGSSACTGLGGDGSAKSSSESRTSSSGRTTAASHPRDASLDDRNVTASRAGSYEDVTVRFDLLSLRRTGNLALLRFTATNTSPGTAEDTDKKWSILTDLGDKPSEYSVNGIYLVDPAHSKKYPTATDAADDCVCSSTSGVEIVPTQSREFSATFAAPPADVSSVDVYVPGAGTIENVPVL